KRVVRTAVRKNMLRSSSRGAPSPTRHPHFPRRAMAGDCVALIARNRVITHPGKKVIGLVIFAHVVEAEPPIFALARASLRCAVGRRLGASRPIARRTLRAQPPILVRLDANSIKKGRVEFHGESLCRSPAKVRKLDSGASRDLYRFPHAETLMNR